MTNLFGDDPSPAFSAGLGSSLTETYTLMILTNPPTPAFFESNPKRESFARHVAKKDVARFLAVLDKLGLTITQKENT